MRSPRRRRRPAYKEVPPDWKTAQPSDQIARGKWWEIFQDPQLNALEEQINVSNENLKAAEAQFQQARALVRFNRAAYYPTVTAGASGEREHLSSNRPLVPVVHPNQWDRPGDSGGCVLRSGRVRANTPYG